MKTIGGKYEIFRQLGQGATAAVYLCFDPFTEREVAVKRILPEVLQDRERGKQFRHLLMNEAALAGKLIHPHIVQIFDAVIGADESYIVMEYIQGGTLEPFCTPAALLPIERVVEIIFKCTHALEYANRLGITHRDIKPANILFAHTDGPRGYADGEIKISDFGACIQSGAEQARTQVTGVGSPAYMSPQQLREEALDHQTDIYSLGVVMFQLLTGRLPFQASSNYSMIYQICNIEPPLPSALRDDLPPALDAIVYRAMRKETEQRYATWQEFAHDLAQAFRNQGLAPHQPVIQDSEKFETLRGMRFFDEFSDVEIWEIVRFARWEAAIAGTHLMRDGDPGNHLIFLVEGCAQVCKEDRILDELGPGEVIGEMAVIDRRHPRRGADVVALTDVRFVMIGAQSLNRSSDACRMHFYQGFLRVLAERLARTNVLLSHT
ncbi:MAG: protein kinase [Sulfuritalea sp.]|nr:protein kinase [Sulfuritalea sp.]